jgi:hypothetical protein
VVENLQKVAFEYGPIVYCAEEADNDTMLLKTPISDTLKFTVEKRNDLLNGVNVLSGSVIDEKGKTSNLTLIPYYAWSNRGVGQMKVWFRMNVMEK